MGQEVVSDDRVLQEILITSPVVPGIHHGSILTNGIPLIPMCTAIPKNSSRDFAWKKITTEKDIDTFVVNLPRKVNKKPITTMFLWTFYGGCYHGANKMFVTYFRMTSI